MACDRLFIYYYQYLWHNICSYTTTSTFGIVVLLLLPLNYTSTDSEKEQITDRGEDRAIESDTTGSTPDICKSPDIIQGRVPGFQDLPCVSDTVSSFEIQVRQEKRKFTYTGVSLVKETEQQDSDSDSDDDLYTTRLTRN